MLNKPKDGYCLYHLNSKNTAWHLRNYLLILLLDLSSEYFELAAFRCVFFLCLELAKDTWWLCVQRLINTRNVDQLSLM